MELLNPQDPASDEEVVTVSGELRTGHRAGLIAVAVVVALFAALVFTGGEPAGQAKTADTDAGDADALGAAGTGLDRAPDPTIPEEEAAVTYLTPEALSGEIRLLECQEAQVIDQPTSGGHAGAIEQIFFVDGSPTTPRLGSIGADGVLVMRDLASGQTDRMALPGVGPVLANSGELLAVRTGDAMVVYTTAELLPVAEAPASTGWAANQGGVFTSEGDALITISVDEATSWVVTTTRWGPTDGGGPASVTLDVGDVAMGAQSWFASPSPGVLMVRTRDQKVIGWDLSTGKRFDWAELPRGYLYDGPALTNEDRVLIGGRPLADPERLELFDVTDGQPVELLQGGFAISTVAIAENGTVAVATVGDGEEGPAGKGSSVRVGEFGGPALPNFSDQVGPVPLLAIDQTGDTLAIVRPDGVVESWPITEGGLVRVARASADHGGPAKAVAASDFGLIATEGRIDGEIRMWPTAETPLESANVDLAERLSYAQEATGTDVAYGGTTRLTGDRSRLHVAIGATELGVAQVDGAVLDVAVSDDGTLGVAVVLPVGERGDDELLLQLVDVRDRSIISTLAIDRTADGEDLAEVYDVDLSAIGRRVALLEGDSVRLFCAEVASGD